MARVLVIYHSRGGNTKAMAEAIAEGAEEVVGPEVMVKEAMATSVDDMVAAQAIAIGSPDHFSYMNGHVKVLFDDGWLRRKELYGKIWTAFSSGGVDGVKSRESIEWVIAYADHFKPKKMVKGISAKGAPGPEQLTACKQIGKELAESL